MNVGADGHGRTDGRHNNAKISLLNGLVWDRRREKEKEKEKENRILILAGRITSYGFLPLETDLVAMVVRTSKFQVSSLKCALS